MADNSLNVTHISSGLDSYEAARSSFFVFMVNVNDLKNLYRPDFNPDNGEAATDDDMFAADEAEQAIRLNVTKSSVPNFTIETHEYRRGNDVVKFAGLPKYKDTLPIVIDDVVGLQTKSILYAWQYAAYNPLTRKGGRMQDYKKTCTLIEYTQDYKVIRRWTISGCFITGIDESDFDKENNDGNKRQLTASIVYDRATMETVRDVF